MRDQRLHVSGLEIAGAEIHGEGRRSLPLDGLRLRGEGRVLVQHRIGRVLALADLEHAAEGLRRAARSVEVSRNSESLLSSALVHSPICCCWPFGPCWATSEETGSLNGAEFDQSRTARVGVRSMICVQFSLVSIWTLRPTAFHISTSTCAVATWLV